jgi:hypothetical protein
MKQAETALACLYRCFLYASFSRHFCLRFARCPLRSIFVSALVLIGGSSNAQAYIDPGYGSLIWQLLIASFFGGLFYARTIIAMIKSWFKGRKHTDKPSASAD